MARCFSIGLFPNSPCEFPRNGLPSGRVLGRGRPSGMDVLMAAIADHKMACMRNLPSSGAMIVAPDQVQEREEVPMAIVGGLDVHRSQITFDYVNAKTGEIRRGQVPGTRLAFRGWLGRIPERPAAFAVEGCTGWRFVVEELRRAGMEAHLAEPADTQALRGPKRHAKTDGIDARQPLASASGARAPTAPA